MCLSLVLIAPVRFIESVLPSLELAGRNPPGSGLSLRARGKGPDFQVTSWLPH